jgi:hypothetical protein
MPLQNRIVQPGFKIGTVLTDSGEVLVPPSDWRFLPAGDGPLTRNVRNRGPSWQVQVKKGRRTISKGIWVYEGHIQAAKQEVENKRSTPEYERRKVADKERRDRKHQEYVQEFYLETLRFLNFHPDHRQAGERLARAVTEHATPVGSGTVARTERIPLPERVQAAVIAWMRHQTTAYDRMHVARIKGHRREIRRMLAGRSNELLSAYRAGKEIGADCPLNKALVEQV